MKRIREAIKAFGGREALAVALGVTAQAVWHWEHGKKMSEPTSRLLYRLMDDLGREKDGREEET